MTGKNLLSAKRGYLVLNYDGKEVVREKNFFLQVDQFLSPVSNSRGHIVLGMSVLICNFQCVEVGVFVFGMHFPWFRSIRLVARQGNFTNIC